MVFSRSLVVTLWRVSLARFIWVDWPCNESRWRGSKLEMDNIVVFRLEMGKIRGERCCWQVKPLLQLSAASRWALFGTADVYYFLLAIVVTGWCYSWIKCCSWFFFLFFGFWFLSLIFFLLFCFEVFLVTL